LAGLTLYAFGDDTMNGLALFGLGVAAMLGLGVAGGAADEGMRIHAMLFAGAAILAVFFLINRIYEPKVSLAGGPDTIDYNDSVVRAGAIASVFRRLCLVGDR